MCSKQVLIGESVVNGYKIGLQKIAEQLKVEKFVGLKLMNENKQEEGSLQKLIESETRKAQQTFKTDKRLRSLPIEKKNEKLESLVAAKIKNIFVSWIDNDRIKQVDPEFLEIPTGYIENGYLHPIIPGDKDTRKMLERLIWLYEDYSFRVHLGTNS